ncbi:MAG: GAF domain-containing protein [Deltaproteobacteria bacterium]|nr:GAF domain-containing protein [Deltaproteobacteria bacterium]
MDRLAVRRRLSDTSPLPMIPLVSRYWRPIFALLLAAPLTIYALKCSTNWFAQPFPGFLMMENGVVPTVGGTTWPEDKARVFHAQVVAVDGKAVTSSDTVYRYVAQHPAGTRFEYTFRNAQGLFTLVLPSLSFGPRDYLETYGILFLFGLICLASGIVVGFLQPERAAARVYLLQAMLTGLYATSAVFLHQPGFPVLGRLCLVLESFFAASWIHVSLLFPIERRFSGRWRILPLAPYLVSAAIATLVLIRFFGTPPDRTPLRVAYVYNSLGLACFIASLVRGYAEARDPLPRLRVKAILVGALICLPWPLLVFLDNALESRSIPLQFALVLTPLGYATLGYAIVKHDMWDIDRIVRRTFAYVLLSVVVLVGYVVLLELPLRVLPWLGAEGRTVIGMVFVLVLALALDPLRTAVQSLVDHAFFRRRLDYRATIRELSAVMTTLLDLREIVTQVTRVVTEAMQLESTAIGLADDERSGTVWRRVGDGATVVYAQRPGVPAVAAAALQQHPMHVSQLADLVVEPSMRVDAERLLAEVDARIVIPISFREHPIGALMLGAKRSGQSFDSEALDLLRTLADQTAIAVQNARSQEALENLNRDLDEQVRARTAELREAYEELKGAQAQLIQSEKMASLGQLVAGVAHELNNPASFVYAGLENIEESIGHLCTVLEAYAEIPINDPQLRARLEQLCQRERLSDVLLEIPELMRISGEGLERIKRIVDDLRTFARADSGERTDTNLMDGLESSVRLLGEQLSRGGIRVVTSCDSDVPRIRANVPQLNQVWMNLLTNAIDALDGRPDPEINFRVRFEGTGPSGGRIEVSVSDNGIGIEPCHLPRLFEPFFTTKPIGRGTGLGLSIAYGAIKAHGGTIEIDSCPGVGTVVVLHLPA